MTGRRGKNDGGQVFPKRIRAINPDWEKLSPKDAHAKRIFPYMNIDAPGMSLRELAAIEIMAARMSNPVNTGTDQHRAERAVKAADLLIAELEKPCES